ncbi:MAG: DUF5605 domain-containing protein [Candidatus Poribacteria bacterium]
MAKPLSLTEGQSFKIEIIDAWEMTITPIDGTFEGNCSVDLPGTQHCESRKHRSKSQA